ncbi:MAG TPA: class I SAM-dependent methyltransferase [Vicinamibacterales bacterium]
MQPDDPWSRVDYRRLISWPERIAREWPLLERVLGSARPGPVLDLGSGTGEHSRHLAEHGFEVVGIDASPSMLEKAAESPSSAVTFVQGDITDVASLAPREVTGAICLGNTLPHLDAAAMRRLAAGLAQTLRPGAPFVFQVLNYERIRAKKLRHLPLNFRPMEGEGEIVFLRLMETHPDGWVTFTPTTLRYDPHRDPPVEVTSTRSVRLYGWTWPELRAIFGGAGFSTAVAYGAFDGSPFDAAESSDIIGVLRR